MKATKNKTVRLTPAHKDDIYDVEIKRIHIAFRRLGFPNMPLEIIDTPTDATEYLKFRDKLRNTWYMRNRNADNLKILQETLLKAKKQ